LWDNGASASDELENVLAIRKNAINNFSTDNVRNKTPYSVLEDVFVPLYFYHRFQTNAASKLIGGLDYTYAVKGQKELVVKRVDGITERKALKAILKTINVNEIAIPKQLLALFPPRAYGYSRTRESFKSKVGVAFDPFGAVQTTTQFTLSFLLHPDRANRLIQHKSLDNSQLGLKEVLDALIKDSFNKNYKDSYYQALQEIVKTEILNAMFVLAADQNIYPQVKAAINSSINTIVQNLKKNTKNALNNEYIQMVSDFKKNPSKYMKINAPKIPDGSPIGSDYKY
jgi:hypothetical protein